MQYNEKESKCCSGRIVIVKTPERKECDYCEKLELFEKITYRKWERSDGLLMNGRFCRQCITEVDEMIIESGQQSKAQLKHQLKF